MEMGTTYIDRKEDNNHVGKRMNAGRATVGNRTLPVIPSIGGKRVPYSELVS
ncbi:MAG: hypothetical protein OXS28_11010 [Gammaproteobacteria bacterium]|nr:hypothetical protein [Gammaproteobacteria bacterium]